MHRSVHWQFVQHGVLDAPRSKSIREAEKSLLVDAFEKVDDLVVPVKQIHGCLPFFFPREEFLMEKTRTDVNPNHPVCREKARIISGGRIHPDRMSFPEEADSPSMSRRGLPGLAGQSLKQGGRVVDQHSWAFVGIDTSKLRNAVAIAEEGRDGDVRYLGEIDTAEAATRKLVVKLAAKHRQLTFCYEAGPTNTGSIG
jgi:hypothetical protein